MLEVSNAGLLQARPMSSEILETLTPPSAVNCGVLGRLRKLNTVVPPRVCAARLLVQMLKTMMIRNRKAIRK
jgi:hypothetical protein